jgi:hypothetical protein
MKKILKKGLLITLLLTSIISFANENIISYKKSSTKKIKLEFGIVKKGHTLLILNKNGIVISNLKIHSDGNYSKIFTFKGLENGIYTAELYKDSVTIIKTLIIKDETVILLNESVKKIFTPTIRNQKDLVIISKIHFDAKPILIKIFYNKEVIFSEKLKRQSDGVINRVYRLSKIEKGDYIIQVGADNRKYKKSFKL